ncbi:hypothetical protein [Rhizobium leguminosarum]|uniref:hypothetical protein n=1 Tax=Rhizobium leguminosarum TaxID=384 RepID=UPI0010313D1B|nr:hypothetical protein [Rhizobium leguminosarum]TAX26341.1 hypothetical protein ELI06_24630 [Rhizobium leguminosarum]
MAEHFYDPVGKCIYCGSTKYALRTDRKLGEEHIIPFGLYGTYVLPEASCKECEKITGRQESKFQRGALLPARTFLSLPTRNKSNRPTELPLLVEDRKVMVKIEHYPACLMLLRFPPPRIIDSSGAWGMGISGKLFSYDADALKLHYGVTKFRWPILRADVLQRVIAKIAHSYAVAKLGIDGFQPSLTHFIRNEQAYGLSNLIGSHHYELEADAGHVMGFAMMEGFPHIVVVRIRLFAEFKMPTYLAVVGTRPGGPPIPDEWKAFDTEPFMEYTHGI